MHVVGKPKGQGMGTQLDRDAWPNSFLRPKSGPQHDMRLEELEARITNYHITY